MKLSAFGTTDVGLVRGNNEDDFLISLAEGLFIVADGMGGHSAGEVASEIAIGEVCETLMPQLVGTDAVADPPGLLADAVMAANRTVRRVSETNPAWQRMGTTLTILLLRDDLAHLAHVGDSRLYRFREGELVQLSVDHTLVEDQLRLGMISDREAAASSLRHVLLQAVGVTAELDICQTSLSLVEQDRFLLCSDGLTDMLSDAQIAGWFAVTGDLTDLGNRLVDEAKAAGGKDNITVVLVQVESR